MRKKGIPPERTDAYPERRRADDRDRFFVQRPFFPDFPKTGGAATVRSEQIVFSGTRIRRKVFLPSKRVIFAAFIGFLKDMRHVPSSGANGPRGSALHQLVDCLHDLIRSNAFHAGMVMSAMFFPVQGAGTAGKIRFQNPIPTSCREKSPCPGSGAEQGDDRSSYAACKMHRT